MDVGTQHSHEHQILVSWQQNAAPWAEAVREGRIDSRRLVTDQAIIEAIRSCSPRRVLDIGCGEGWLVRALASLDIAAVGIDAVPALIELARRAGGEFELGSYEDLVSGRCPIDADVAVCNFALFGKESVEHLLTALPLLLRPHAALILQTLHPVSACGDLPYADGWRPGTWAGVTGAFLDPAPWYFRTVQSWLRLLERSGLRIQELREPTHPLTGLPASLIMIARVAPG